MQLRILLTGASGMVGRNICEHPFFKSVELIAPPRQDLDLTDYNATRSYISDIKPDLVIHAAGKVGGIQANILEPTSFLVQNVDIGRNVILATRDCGVRRLLNLGSSCMYPRNNINAMDESLILSGELEPTNEGYALAKIYTARLAEYVTREGPGINYKTLIPCNLYGKYDKFHPVQSHLIPAIILKIHGAMKEKQTQIDIWGDGEARREFMYVGDLAAAISKGVAEFDGLPSITNIGLGYDFSINEYYRTVADVLGFEGTFFHDLTKPVGMSRKLLSVSKQAEWGWSPQYNLRDGIKLTYEYFLKEIQS